MPTYEEQLIKWAAKRYKIAGKDIDEVGLSVEAYTMFAGCDGSCGCDNYNSYGPETTQECHILVYGKPDARKKRKVKKTETIELDWSSNFSEILKEIIEA